MPLPETQYARAPDGVQIAYQVTGDGGVDLVLMQGAVAHLELQWEDPKFSRLFERLSAFSRLIRFDRRGMGMSGVLDRFPTFEDQVEDFGVVMDAAGSDRAAVMGTIDAGTLALAFAAAYPERTQAVVAFETAPRFTRSDADDFGVDPDVMSRFAEAAQSMDVEGTASIVAPGRMKEPGFLSWFRRYGRSAQSGIPAQAFVMMTMSADIVDRLSAVEAPVLVLHKAAHTLMPIRSARALAEALPNAHLVELPGTGTAIFSNEVEEVADESRRSSPVPDRRPAVIAS